MDRIKINLNKIVEGGDVTISLGDDSTPLDNTKDIENQFIEKEVENAINEIRDNEKVRFQPFSGYTEVVVKLMVSGSTELTYSDLGFTNEDLIFRRNRFTNSFLKLNFYDNNVLSNRRLAFQNLIYSQINEDQRDVNGDLLDVSNMPVTFRITDPIQKPNGDSEGFYIYWLKNDPDGYPKTFYIYFSYGNASDGEEIQYLAYDGSIPINLYSSLNWVECRLSSIGNLNEYLLEDSNRTINYLSDRIEILLYPVNLT